MEHKTNFKIIVIRDKAHLKFVASLPCCVSGLGDVQAAHIRKRCGAGMGYKSGDNFTVPLNFKIHQKQHNLGNEEFFWYRYGGIDKSIALANAIYNNTGDTYKCLELIRNFRIGFSL